MSASIQTDLPTIARAIRRLVVQSVYKGQGGHIGGPLSAADLLAALYFRTLRVRPEQPDWPDRDRFVLSKGHSAIGLYAALALRGFFPVEELDTFDQVDSRLQGHPDMTITPGVDMSTGSLGQGLSAALGMALAARLTGRAYRSYVLLGDGECQEGQVWEAAWMASRYGVDNLTAIVDWNGLQQFGWQATGYQPPDTELDAKWQAFGWQVIPIAGHDFDQIQDAIARAQATRGKPTVILARTVKGKGVSFMENDYGWHSRVPSQGELERALAELGGE